MNVPSSDNVKGMSTKLIKSEVANKNPATEKRQALHPKLPQYAVEDIVMRCLVKKRSRFVLKLSRELCLLKDGSFAYFTCDK